MDHNEAIPRSDRVLLFALAIVLATASAAIGAGMTHHPARPAMVITRTVNTPVPVLLDIPAADLLAEHQCLSEALYYEARGEGSSGQRAVAEVVLHRLRTGNYGRSICAVVYEGATRPGCQFSFTCDRSMHRLRDPQAWQDSEQLAAAILTGAVKLDNVTASAINYHATSVNPYWAPTLHETAKIGNHIFYRHGKPG